MTETTRAWAVARSVTLVMFLIVLLCIVSQQLNGTPDSVSHLVFDFGGYVLAGFILSALLLFVISLSRWGSLSNLQRALGLGVFPLSILVLLLGPTLH
jgi:hypothetical protein